MRTTDIIDNFVRELLGDDFKNINFVPNFDGYDLDIVILTKNHGFIKFPVNFENLIDKTPEEVNEYLREGLRKLIEETLQGGKNAGEHEDSRRGFDERKRFSSDAETDSQS